MIQKISERILNYLLTGQVIENTADDKEYYQYGIEIIVSSVISIILIMLIGVLTKNIVESVIFLICFIPLRQFTGGFHADTYLKCNTSFCIVFLSVLLLYHATAKYLHTSISILIALVCVSVIIVLCPVEHINKPIPDNRKKYYKIMAAVLGSSYGIIGTVLTAFSNMYGSLILYILLLVTALIVAAKIKPGRCKNEEKQL